jgi:CheY-like chemotaxis protein
VSKKRARLLVVDDEPMLGQTLRLAFQEQYDVVVTQAGGEALDRLQGDKAYDLVLCDLMMPGISGIRVWEEVRLQHPELLPKFVFMTGGAFTDVARDFLERYEGMRLEKPFTVHQVEQLLEQMLDRSK